MIKADTREIATLTHWLLTGNRKFRAASAMWLNRAVYHTRLMAAQEIQSSMVARNKGFIKKSLSYTKCSRGASLGAQVAYVGSTAGPGGNSTGWAEQEKVRKDSRKKTIKLPARGNNKKRSVRGAYRMNGGGRFRSPAGYKGGNPHRRAVGLLAHVERENIREPFLLYGHHNFPEGMFILRGRAGKRKFTALQLFGRSPAKTRVNLWLRRAKDKYMSTVNTRAVWGDIVRRLLKPRKNK